MFIFTYSFIQSFIHSRKSVLRTSNSKQMWKNKPFLCRKLRWVIMTWAIFLTALHDTHENACVVVTEKNENKNIDTNWRARNNIINGNIQITKKKNTVKTHHVGCEQQSGSRAKSAKSCVEMFRAIIKHFNVFLHCRRRWFIILLIDRVNNISIIYF
jgi:hypothetical protein